MYARNSGDRRPPQNQPKERVQRPVHISSPRSRDLIPPADYGGTALHDTREEEVINFNPRNDQINLNSETDIPAAVTDDMIPDEPEQISVNDGEEDGTPSDSDTPDRTEPRRPLVSRDEYEESFGRRAAKKTQAEHNMTDKSLLPGILPPLSDEMLLIALIVLFMMSGSDDEMIIILAFLLLMR